MERFFKMAAAVCAWVIIDNVARLLSTAGFVLPFPDWAVNFILLGWQSTIVRPLFASLDAAWLARCLCLAAAGARVCRLASAVRRAGSQRATPPNTLGLCTSA